VKVATPINRFAISLCLIRLRLNGILLLQSAIFFEVKEVYTMMETKQLALGYKFLLSLWRVYVLFVRLVLFTTGTFFLIFVACGFYSQDAIECFTFVDFIDLAFNLFPIIFLFWVSLFLFFYEA
jgi:hypothetical protein